MIVVTGGAGFLGSALIWGLNRRGYEDILVVDRLHNSGKWKNLRELRFRDFVDKQDFIEQVRDGGPPFTPRVLFHLGACSSTTETDMGFLLSNNYEYSRDLARYARERDVRMIYASSAATYGAGEQGYSDDHEKLEELRPLNPYAYSKHLFDLYAKRRGWLEHLVGLKYFNVYGPNEYHKGEMRSLIHKSLPQVQTEGRIRLFKSHRDDYDHGQQERDFIYVKDVVSVTLFFFEHPDVSGIFNVGTGRARTFDDLAHGVFQSLDQPVNIEYYDMPEAIRSTYQYSTRAEIRKLREAGYDAEFCSLEDGIRDYLQSYLLTDSPHLNP